MDTGERIKQARKKRGMSAEELAEKVGVSPSTIYRYENNDISNMGIDKLKAIAKALHTHAYILLGWDEGVSVPHQFERIVSLMNGLNEDGKRRVESYAEDLVDSGKYTSASGGPANIDQILKKECDEVDAEMEKSRALSND